MIRKTAEYAPEDHPLVPIKELLSQALRDLDLQLVPRLHSTGGVGAQALKKDGPVPAR